MSPPPKSQEECLHFTIWRIPPDKKDAVLDFNGRGLLRPMLQCNDCGSVFYIVDKKGSRKKKPDSEG